VTRLELRVLSVLPLFFHFCDPLVLFLVRLIFFLLSDAFLSLPDLRVGALTSPLQTPLGSPADFPIEGLAPTLSVAPTWRQPPRQSSYPDCFLSFAPFPWRRSLLPILCLDPNALSLIAYHRSAASSHRARFLAVALTTILSPLPRCRLFISMRPSFLLPFVFLYT